MTGLVAEIGAIVGTAAVHHDEPPSLVRRRRIVVIVVLIGAVGGLAVPVEALERLSVLLREAPRSHGGKITRRSSKMHGQVLGQDRGAVLAGRGTAVLNGTNYRGFAPTVIASEK